MSPEPVRIIGSYVSPYVRKVLVCLELKGIPYEIDPIVPFFGDEQFSRLSPLRRVPVLVDDAVTLADSTVICEYLDERHPEPPLLPAGPERRARARWLEEFADTRIGEVVIWGLFNEVVIKRSVWGQPADPALVRRAIDEEIPSLLDYLEGVVPAAGLLFGPIALADVAIASFFRNAGFARYSVDPGRWPRCAAYLPRVLEHPGFLKLRPFEELCLRTPIARQRDALREAGAPISAETLGTPTPRRGIVSI